MHETVPQPTIIGIVQCRLRCRVLGISAIAALTACGGDASGPGLQATTVAIQPSQATLEAIEATVTLAAEVRDQNGNAMTGTTIAWNSVDPGVASVDANGKVTARGNGMARITATASQVADTATITVAQAVTALALTPVRDTVTAGESVQLAVVARDANGHAVAQAPITWSSSDTTIAVVSASGVVSGRFRGEVTISARAGTIQGSATITVLLGEFRPTANTTIGGSVAYGRFEIPAGVTVTVSSNLTLLAADSLVIAGTLKGNCVAMELRAEGPMRVRGGTIDNWCLSEDSVPKRLRLVNDDVQEFDGATVNGGSLEISNAALAPMSQRMRHGSPVARALANGVPHPCSHLNSTFQGANGSRGLDGTPFGEDGWPGGDVMLDCTGVLTLDNTSVKSGRGGNGGLGEATSSFGAFGGDGGRGGDVTLTSPMVVAMVRVGGPTLLEPGGSGSGGKATAGFGDRAEATGGNAGRTGLLHVISPVITVHPGAVVVRFDFGRGRGGEAEVNAEAGADATPFQPAQPGPSAIARGGQAQALPNDFLVVGHMFQGTVAGVGNVLIEHSGASARGGHAIVAGGGGGNGNRQFKHGGAGGSHVVAGGTGMTVRIIDNRGAATAVGDPGNGGNADVSQHAGGFGWSDCVVGSIEEGGLGGPGGMLTMSAGAPGTSPGGGTGQVGSVTVTDAANGGVGGDGEQLGNGGNPGSADVLLGVLNATNSMKAGRNGRPCGYAMTALAIVNVDPAGHEPFLNITRIIDGTVRLLPNNGIEVTFGIKMTGTLIPGPNGTFTFTAAGSGTISNRTASGTLTNTLVQVDANGRLLRVTGLFTFGSGGQLPGGSPVLYLVDLTAPAQL